MSLPWPVSENALLSPFADVVLSLGQLALSAHKLDPVGQAQRLANRLCYFMRTHDPMAGGMPNDELAPLALDFFTHSELPTEFTSDLLVTGKHGAISELSDRARFASDKTRSQVFRERFPRLVSSLPIMAKLLDGSAPLDKWTLSQRLVERTGHSSGSTEVSTYIELEDELSKIEDVISKDGEAHDRVQSLLLFLDDRARRRVSAPAGSSSSSEPSAAGVSSFSTGSELAELLASPHVMGPNGLTDRLKLASAHVATDAAGVATNVPADFIKLLAVAIDSRLAPLYRHVLHKQTQDSHEIFTLTGPAIRQLGILRPPSSAVSRPMLPRGLVSCLASLRRSPRQPEGNKRRTRSICRRLSGPLEAATINDEPRATHGGPVTGTGFLFPIPRKYGDPVGPIPVSPRPRKTPVNGGPVQTRTPVNGDGEPP